MDYSLRHFGKSLNNLTYSDIETYFQTEKEESETMEFKAFSAQYGNFNKNIEGVIRGICAFLNSEGGILVWGAPEGTIPQGKTEKIFVGNLSPVAEIKTKDWIINKVSDSISSLPIGIQVSILNNQQGDAAVYIFEVQKSNYRPHQYNRTYWARLDGQTKPAPHYLIEALFRQISYPNIEGYIKPIGVSVTRNGFCLDVETYIFNFSELQNEESVTMQLTCPQGTFVNQVNPQYYALSGHQYINRNIAPVLTYGQPVRDAKRLYISSADLIKSNNQVELMLAFYGKYSPLKMTQYKLDLSRPDLNPQINNHNYLIIEKDENKLSSENGNTKEQIISTILER